jgi:hypothetical protein
MSQMCPVVVVLSLAIGVAAAAQSVGTDQQLSGAWGLGGRVFLELNADGAGAVSGTVHYYLGTSRYPAPIRTGRFDASRRTLRLEGEVAVAGDDVRAFTIDATLDTEALRADYAFGSDIGRVTLTKMKTSG